MNWSPGELVELESEKYILRSLTPGDLTDQFVSWFGDRDVMEFVDLPFNLNLEKTTEMVARYDNRKNFILGIFLKEDGSCIGYHHAYCNELGRNARIAVVIGDKDFWGKGVILETRPILLDFLFNTLSLHKVYGAVFARNLPAVFNYKTLGFRCEGVLKEECPDNKGGWHDIYRFAMFDREWGELKKKGGDR